MKEIWKDIKGYEGLYQVSNLGRVKSKRKILSPSKGEYLKVVLSKNGVEKVYTIHRLVAKAFIDNFENKPQVNHKDENKHNNVVDNLEWVTNKENMNYGTRNKRIIENKRHTFKKIIQKDKNNKIIHKWKDIVEIQEKTKYNKHNIYKCCENKYKYAYGYKWEYSDL